LILMRHVPPSCVEDEECAGRRPEQVLTHGSLLVPSLEARGALSRRSALSPFLLWLIRVAVKQWHDGPWLIARPDHPWPDNIPNGQDERSTVTEGKLP
jgi:hypothetical protein